MKKLLTLLFVLLLPLSAAADCPFTSEGGIGKFLCDLVYAGDVTFEGSVSIPGGVTDPTAVKQTTADVTYYVRTTGNDSNDCLSTGDACLTVQAAVNLVPKRIDHVVAIDVGAGNFAGFQASGFHVKFGGSFTVQGTIGDFSPSTGTGSGTATGGSSSQCVDSGQSWTADNLRGALALVGGEYRTIRTNDATSFDVIGPFGATCSGESYAIKEQATVFDSSGVYAWLGRVEYISNLAPRDKMVLNDVKTSGGTIGVLVMNSWAPQANRIRTTGAAYGMLFQAVSGEVQMYDIAVDGFSVRGFTATRCAQGVREASRMFAFNGGGMGLEVYGTPMALSQYWYADDITGADSIAIRIAGVTYSQITHGGVNTSAGRGYVAERATDVAFLGNIEVINCTGPALDILDATADVETFTGSTGNSSWGVIVSDTSRLYVTTATTVTGSSGDATITDGDITLTWATDFAIDGDIETNLSNGCRIERRD